MKITKWQAHEHWIKQGKHRAKYMATEKDYKITFQDIDAVSFSETLDLVGRLLELVLDRVLRNAEPHLRVRLVFRCPELASLVQIPFTKKVDLDAQGVIDHVVQVLNSNESFHIHPGITLNVIHVAVPRGGRRKRVTSFDAKKVLHSKCSVVVIKNKDDPCFGRI